MKRRPDNRAVQPFSADTVSRYTRQATTLLVPCGMLIGAGLWSLTSQPAAMPLSVSVSLALAGWRNRSLQQWHVHLAELALEPLQVTPSQTPIRYEATTQNGMHSDIIAPPSFTARPHVQAVGKWVHENQSLQPSRNECGLSGNSWTMVLDWLEAETFEGIETKSQGRFVTERGARACFAVAQRDGEIPPRATAPASFSSRRPLSQSGETRQTSVMAASARVGEVAITRAKSAELSAALAWILIAILCAFWVVMWWRICETIGG
jgi:hypothetical protein